MNRTFKTIWNAVRGAYVTVNENVAGASQKSGSAKAAVLAVAVAAAMTAGAAQAAATYVDGNADGFQLSQQNEQNYTYDFVASTIRLESPNSASEGTAKFTFSQANVENIRKVAGFENFGVDGDQLQYPRDIWSSAAGIQVRSSQTAADAFSLSKVDVDVAMDEGVENTDLVGIFHDAGVLSVTGPASIKVNNDVTGTALGYVLDNNHDGEDSAVARKANFAETVTIEASTRVEGGVAAGVYMRANAKDLPVITFSKATTITANAASGEAGGLILNYSDNTSNAATSVAKDGSISTSDLTINAAGGRAAAAILVDVGEVKVNGKADIKASGSDNSYGIALRGDGKAIFNGDTTVTAANALYLTQKGALTGFGDDGLAPGFEKDSSKDYEYGQQSSGKAAAEFNGTTTLNGALTQEAGTTITNNGSMTVAGNVAIGGDFANNGTLKIDTATSLDLTGKLNVGSKGKLVTTSAQIFTTALNENGTSTNADSLKYGAEHLVFTKGSSLDVTDAKFNIDYSKSAAALVSGSTVHFTGTLVDADGSEKTDVKFDDMSEGTVFDKVQIDVKPNESGATVTIDKNVGGQLILAGDAAKLEISANKNLTITGTTDNKEIVQFDGDGTVDINGSLTLGKTGGDTKGTLSATLNIKSSGGLTVQGGSFTLDSVKLDVDAGKSTEISINDGASLTFKELTAATGEHIIKGAVNVGKLIAEGAKDALIRIGTDEGSDARKGSLTVAEGGLKGLKFFLDPTWVDGMEVTDASNLILNQTSVDGQIVVGQNSYVVLGADNDDAFLKLVADGKLTWGGENGTLAAVYVAQPITIDKTTGSLTVDSTLTGSTYKTTDGESKIAETGSVIFAAGSTLVADVTKNGDKPAITVEDGAAITVDKKSKAVVIAEKGQSFKLTNKEKVNQNAWNKVGESLISANPLVKFEVDADGTIKTDAEDAEDAFGGLMQGAALMNAGADTDYVKGLVTDATGKKSLAQRAREFDAAMNPAGALGVFTTGKDRSTELRDAVRTHAGASNGLWAQITGGKTKLKGISTGAQDLDLDTTAYGLAIGGEGVVSNVTLGGAFTAGSGKTENDSVSGKDDFDYYGLSFYAKTEIQGVELTGDVSATWLKSNLTVGGAADVDADTTTAVYSLGVQAQKTFDLGVNVTPFVGVDVYHVKSDGFTTAHGVSVDDSDATIVEFPIGAKISKAFETSSGFSVAPAFSLAVVPTVGSKDIDSKVKFAGAESTYNFTFADDVKIRSQFGLEAQKENLTFGIQAGYDWGNEERSAASVQLRAKYAF